MSRRVYNAPALRRIEIESEDMMSPMSDKVSCCPWRVVHYLPILEEKQRQSGVYLVGSLYHEQGLVTHWQTSWLDWNLYIACPQEREVLVGTGNSPAPPQRKKNSFASLTDGILIIT